MSAQIQFSTKDNEQPKLPAQFCVLSSTTGTAAEARFQAWLREGRGEAWGGELNLWMFILQLGEHFEFLEQRCVLLFFCARSSHSPLASVFSSPSHDWCEPVRTYNSASNYKEVVHPRGLAFSVSDMHTHILYIWVHDFLSSPLWVPLSF